LHLPVSVNIDAIHLEQADFVDRLRLQLAKTPRKSWPATWNWKCWKPAHCKTLPMFPA
jgi:hypothetical protein